MEKLIENLEAGSQRFGYSHFGVSGLTPLSIEIYKSWLDEGYFGEMKYLQDHLATKSDPRTLMKEAKSAFVFAFPYFPEHPKPHQAFPGLRVALYAQGADYHHWLKEKLTAVAAEMKALHPNEEFLCFTDSSPILERDFAYQAGLGWYGKNTCLIHPKKGSLFLIGEILSSMPAPLMKSEPLPDFCGKCQKCIEICPTESLIAPKKLDATKCISYLTIESRQIPPENLREGIGDLFFGCDLCQTVCPWNQKAFGDLLKVNLPEDEGNEGAVNFNVLTDLRFLLTASGKQIEKKVVGTPMMRAGSFGLRRNAMIVAANRGFKELRPEIEAFLNNPKLGELADWSLKKLNSC